MNPDLVALATEQSMQHPAARRDAPHPLIAKALVSTWWPEFGRVTVAPSPKAKVIGAIGLFSVSWVAEEKKEGISR